MRWKHFCQVLYKCYLRVLGITFFLSRMGKERVRHCVTWPLLTPPSSFPFQVLFTAHLSLEHLYSTLAQDLCTSWVFALKSSFLRSPHGWLLCTVSILVHLLSQHSILSLQANPTVHSFIFLKAPTTICNYLCFIVCHSQLVYKV